VLKNEHFGQLRREFTQCGKNKLLTFSCQTGAIIYNDRLIRRDTGTAKPDDIQRNIHRSPMQIPFWIAAEIECMVPAKQSKEECLKDILRILGGSGDPVCRSINERAMFLKQLLKVSR
jgi:hypothetical protein